jgi:hypothetical protein
MYKARIVTQFIVALYVFFTVAIQFRGYGKIPIAFTVAALVSALWLVTCRTTWLPFLGPSAMPVGVFKPTMPAEANVQYELVAPENAVRVVYWGSSIKAKDPIQAYGGYVNSGVADVTADRKALIKLQKPKEYSVWGRTVKPHVHYRWVTARGILSSVKTMQV